LIARAQRANWLLLPLVLASALLHAQSATTADVQLRLVTTGHAKQSIPPSVFWLKPIQQTPVPAFPVHGNYTLLQKNRMFTPHLLVVPVGTVVQFPNADPFFHNVFSLFDGKRFDLGLYEAGSTKAVTFSREGISYIFCNIHPEMSAVVLSLSTPLYAIADSRGAFHLRDVAPGEYELHLWIEGVPESTLDKYTRHIHLTLNGGDLGQLAIPAIVQRKQDHPNKFGQPYDKETKGIY
jgi:plastocyanin